MTKIREDLTAERLSDAIIDVYIDKVYVTLPKIGSESVSVCKCSDKKPSEEILVEKMDNGCSEEVKNRSQRVMAAYKEKLDAISGPDKVNVGPITFKTDPNSHCDIRSTEDERFFDLYFIAGDEETYFGTITKQAAEIMVKGINEVHVTEKEPEEPEKESVTYTDLQEAAAKAFSNLKVTIDEVANRVSDTVKNTLLQVKEGMEAEKKTKEEE